MRVGFAQQQSNERKSYTISYERAFDDGDTLQEISACFVEPEGLTVSPFLADEDRVRLVVAGGVDNQRYKITVRVLTRQGEILEDELLCRVKDI